MSITDPKLSEMEKQLILLLRTTAGWSWQNIADELNKRFSCYNNGTRHRDTVYKFMVRYRKEQRAQMIAELRAQGFPEDEIVIKMAEEYTDI